MKKTRLALRNKLIRTLNENWSKFGAKVAGLTPPIPGQETDTDFHWRFVQGVTKGGRAILIYPLLGRDEKIPFRICKHMKDFEDRGAVVGCAAHLGDCYTIIADDPVQYKRFKKTFAHRRWYIHYLKSHNKKGKTNG